MDILIVIAAIAWAIININRKAKQAGGQGARNPGAPRRGARDMRNIFQRDMGEDVRPEPRQSAAAPAEAAMPAQEAYIPPRDYAPQDSFTRLASDEAFSYGAADYTFRQENRKEGPSRFEPRESAPAPEAKPLLNLCFNKNAIVEGVVYSEILGNRPRGRSNRWNRYVH